MRRGILLLASLFLAIPGRRACPEEWTLDRTIEAALKTSSAAALDRYDAESAGLDARSAQAGWRPSVSANAGANYVSEVMSINLPGRTVRFGDNESYSFKLGVNQLLYDGGRLNALREAGRNRAEMSLHQAAAAELGAELQGKSAFYSVSAAQENVSAAEQSVLEARSHLENVTALRGEGMALEDDVVLSRLRVSQAEMGLVTRRADLERAKASFRTVTGLAPEAEVSVQWRPLEPSLPDSTPVQTALRLRPEFNAFDSAIRAAEKSIESARADRRPNVGLTGAFNYGRPGLDLPSNDWMHWFSGGVALNWNLWDWGRVSREVEKAEIARNKTSENREEFRRAVTKQVSDALAGYEEAREREALARESLDYAERHLELVNVSFREDMSTERDYETAFALAERARYDAAAARSALQISMAQVEYVLGIRYTGGNR